MKFGQGFRGEMDGKVGLELDHLMAGIRGGWKVEHDADGHHTDITSNTAEVAGMTSFGGPWFLPRTAVCNPPQLSANTHNYNPNGLSDANWLRLDVGAAINLTGIQVVLAEPSDMRWLLLTNVGNFNLTLKHADAGSSPSYQFGCPGSVDFVLGLNASVWLLYDSFSAAWRVLSA